MHSVVFYGHSSLYSIMVTRQIACTTPRRGGLRFGSYVLQDNFVPSRRFREDGLLLYVEDLKLSTGGGARVNTLGTPAMAKQTRPINSNSLQVQVEPVVSTP